MKLHLGAVSIEKSSAFPQPSAAPKPAGLAAGAPEPSATPTPQSTITPEQFVTIVRPVRVQIPYGQTVLQPGMKLPVVSRHAETVWIKYMGETYPIPVTSTDSR
jgi:hypothetical protein